MITMKNLDCSYVDARRIPIYQRRYMLMKLKEVHDDTLEEMENTTSSTKGKQSFSGEALKNKFKSGEIPN